MEAKLRALTVSRPQHERSFFDELPLELWAAVSGKLLSHPRSLSALRRVSRRCREAVEWSIRNLEPQAGIAEADLLQLLQRFHGIKTLQLNDVSQPASIQLLAALRRLHKLRKLQMSGRCDLLVSAPALAACRRLTAVHLERSKGYHGPDVYAAISQMRRLRSVVLRDESAAAGWGKAAPDAGLGLQALEVLQRLTHLDLGGVAAPAVARIAACLPVLSSLVIKVDIDPDDPVGEGSQEDQLSMTALARVPLVSLTIAAHLDAALLQQLQLPCSLVESTWIQIGNCLTEEEGVEEASRKARRFLGQLRGLTALTSPALEWLKTEEDAARVVPHLSSLQHLTLEQAEFTPAAAEALKAARITARLRTLAAEGASGGGLSVALPALRATTALRVNSADVDPRGQARDLARLAGMLRELDMRAATPADDEDIAALVCLGTLTCLRLGSSARGAMSLNISDAAVSSIAGGLPFLRRLQLSGARCLTDGGLAPLALLSKLTNLRLDGCSKLTGQGLADLAVAEVPLRKLRLDGTACNDGGLVVVSVIPHLTSLHIGSRPAQQGIHLSWAPWSQQQPPPPDFQMRLLEPGSCQVDLPDGPHPADHRWSSAALTALMEDSAADPSATSSYYYDPSGSMQHGHSAYFNPYRQHSSSYSAFSPPNTNLNPPLSGSMTAQQQPSSPTPSGGFTLGSPVHGGTSALAACAASTSQDGHPAVTAFDPFAAVADQSFGRQHSPMDTSGDVAAADRRPLQGLRSHGSFGIASLNNRPMSASAVTGALALANASTHGGSLFGGAMDPSGSGSMSIACRAGASMHNGPGLRKFPPSPIRRLIIDSSNLSDASLEEAAAALPSLAHLELRQCSRPDGGGLAALKNHRQLARIAIRECGGITSACLQQGIAPLTQLQELSVVKCSGIRPSALARVQSNFTAATGRNLRLWTS